MANLNQVELEELKDQYREFMRQYGGTNLAGQQTPDGTYGYYTPDFSYGSYKIPYQDPTYSSGYEYARTIAGGMPFEDVVAPGMSFSPEEPMGYTQADLRRKEIYGDFDGVMPVAPTQGTPLKAPYETMPYAPVGTPAPEPYVPGQTTFPGIPSFLQDLDFSFLQDLDFSNLPGVKTEEVIEPQQDFFKVDQNLFNFEEIADKIDMDEVAKIDIEKINIPESVSLFSDILKEPVSAEPVIPKPVLPSIFEPAAPEMPITPAIQQPITPVFQEPIIPITPKVPVMPRVPVIPEPVMQQPIKAPVIPAQTLPQNIFANIPKPQPMPVIPNIPNIPKLPIVPQPIIPQPIMPTSTPRVSTPLIPSFVQPNIEEIVRPIAVGKKGLPQYGLFNLA